MTVTYKVLVYFLRVYVTGHNYVECNISQNILIIIHHTLQTIIISITQMLTEVCSLHFATPSLRRRYHKYRTSVHLFGTASKVLIARRCQLPDKTMTKLMLVRSLFKNGNDCVILDTEESLRAVCMAV